MTFLSQGGFAFVLLVLIGTTVSDDRVIVGYYAEALCPFCLELSNGPLADAFEKIPDIFVLDYVPWGNAKLESGVIRCQHGPMECTMNTVMACVLNYYPNQTDFWPFLHCIDKYKEEQNLEVAQRCAKETNVDWEKISTCESGKMGHSLDLKYANVTAQLNPPHEYTPWITINGKHNKRAEDKGMIEEICKSYMGPNRPAACSSV